MTLGERLKQERLARNMSLAAMARVSGLSKGFLSQVESGATNPSLGSLRRLAEALSISVADLMSAEVAPSPAPAAMRPRLVRRVQPERDRSSLKQIGSSSHGAVFLAHLLPGSALMSTASAKGDDAYLMVLSGEVTFRQEGSSLRLAEGDSLTFSLSQHYSLTVQNPLRASLLLMLRSAADLPRAVDIPPGEVVGTPTRIRFSRAEYQGPLRLVAMRAARAAEGER